MTDTQILTVFLAALPTTIVVMIGILMNNARLTDLRNDMSNRFADTIDASTIPTAASMNFAPR